MNYKEIKISITGINILILIFNSVSVINGGSPKFITETSIFVCTYFIICAIENLKETYKNEVVKCKQQLKK